MEYVHADFSSSLLLVVDIKKAIEEKGSSFKYFVVKVISGNHLKESECPDKDIFWQLEGTNNKEDLFVVEVLWSAHYMFEVGPSGTIEKVNKLRFLKEKAQAMNQRKKEDLFGEILARKIGARR